MKLTFHYMSFQASDTFQWYNPTNQVSAPLHPASGSVLFEFDYAIDMLKVLQTSSGIGLQQFTTWLEQSGVDLQGDRAAYVFSKFDHDNNTELTVREYVDKRLQPGDHLCHSPEDMDTAAVAFAGCACNPIAEPAFGACPQGIQTLLC